MTHVVVLAATAVGLAVLVVLGYLLGYAAARLLIGVVCALLGHLTNRRADHG